MKTLTLHQATKHDMPWVREMVVEHHYLHQWPHPLSRPSAYILKLGRLDVGVVVVGIPHAARCRGWWGYDGLPTQWQVVDISRIWVSSIIQKGGEYCDPATLPGFTDRKGVFRPTTISDYLIPTVLERVQRDRVSSWPPVFMEQPYHIRLVVSYHDPQLHKGTIYQASGAVPMYVDKDGRATSGPSGKVGWCWRLPEPAWAWQDIEIERPRTLRLAI